MSKASEPRLDRIVVVADFTALEARTDIPLAQLVEEWENSLAEHLCDFLEGVSRQLRVTVAVQPGAVPVEG